MKREKRFGKVRIKGYLVWGAALLVLSLVISYGCKQYYQKLYTALHEESGSYLYEISGKIGSNVSKIVKDNFAMLETIKLLTDHIALDTFEELRKLTEEQKEYWKFNDLILMDANGVVYNTRGKSIVLTEVTYLNQLLERKQSIFLPTQVIDGEECLVFMVPTEGVKIAGKEIHGLGATYRLNDFDRILATATFDGQAYTYIINADGTTAIPSSSEFADKMGYNVWKSLEEMAVTSKEEMQLLKSDMHQRNAGRIQSNIAGIDKYVVYYPMDTLNWYLLTFVPVALAEEQYMEFLRFTIAFFVFIFVIVATLMTILIVSFMSNKRRLEKLAFVDSVTGGNTIQYFYSMAEKLIGRAEENTYAMVYTNLEKFRLINEQMGRKVGDQLLLSIEEGVESDLGPLECMGHMAADHYCVMILYDNEERLVRRFQEWYKQMKLSLKARGLELEFLQIQFGVFLIADELLSFDVMVGRAKFALNSILNASSGNRIKYSIFDDTANRKLFREVELESRMEKALKDEEFEVYMQPKYITSTGCIGGAEALVRWSRSPRGMIYPDEFVPLFERNGFIGTLDLWVFEQVCKMQQRWMREGKEPVVISVNCSRVQLNKIGFLRPYAQILKQYGVPAKYLEIELTESVVYENMQGLVAILNEIHEMGMGCALDDFGSGYSSLNMIQDIKADTLKLDRIFFSTVPQNKDRAEAVVSSIVDMAKALSMTTVAEGVEYLDQVEFLKSVGCDYIQGYVYSKPIPMEEFEQLLFGK